ASGSRRRLCRRALRPSTAERHIMWWRSWTSRSDMWTRPSLKPRTSIPIDFISPEAAAIRSSAAGCWRLTISSSTQTPHAAMRLIAHMLGREEKSVRVIAPDVGGGFGPKLVFYSEELVVALAAVLLRRPVKWVEDRREHFISTTQERDQVWNLEIAVDSENAIRGVRGSMIHDHGA